MKEWQLRFLIIFSLLSMTGLILIQTYWIKDAINVKERHFRQTVNQAVTRAMWRLERLALASAENDKEQLLRQKKQKSPEVNLLTPDVLDTLPIPSYMKALPDTVSLQSRSIPPPKFFYTDSDHTDRSDDDTVLFRQDDINRIMSGKNPAIQTALDSVLLSLGKISGEIELFNFTRQQLEDELKILSESDPNNLKVRFTDSSLIAELLSEELGNEGLKLNFYFSLYLPFSGTRIYHHSPEIDQALMRSGYVYSLFPALKLSRPIYLVVDFPGEERYLFAKQGLILSVSFILILILIFSFYHITRSIYRQKKLGEMKNDFINNMTHEFKTPVSTISLACEALRDQDLEKSPAFYDNYLKIIDDENKRLGKMAERILQTAIIDKGHLYLYFEPVDMHELIHQVIQKYKPVADQRNGILQTKLLASNPVITGDRTHLHNMISNLVDNGIKYSGEQVEIGILTQDTPDEMSIMVQDRGIGISKANQKRIFEKLFRVPTGNLHDVKGFGLGLSYVKYIIDRHAGSIKVESELQKGSVFRITLPRNHPA
jgi:two-component system, OmpR family, phosphate regulon sensor histidine kinase PhoR